MARRNLSDADLSQQDFSGSRLSGADLSGSDLSGAKFCGADLSGANLTDAQAEGADFTGANLSGAKLSATDLTDASFAGADLSDAEIAGVIGDADFTGANLTRARISFDDDICSLDCLNGVNLSGAELSMVSIETLSDSDLSGARLEMCDLRDADLKGSKLDGTSFYCVELGGADLSGCDLSKTGPDQVSLLGANLARTDLSGRVFSLPEGKRRREKKGVREGQEMEVGEGKRSKEWPEGSLGAALSELEEVRREHLRVHELVPVLLVSVAAMISGMKSLYSIAQWARERQEDRPEFLEELGFPPGRTPSVATLHRVFRRLKVQSFEAILGNWLRESGAGTKEPIALNGKTLRGIHGEEIPGVHLVSAFALTTSTVLYQQATSGKGGELKTVKEVLKEIPLTGRVVMTDALSTQREVCQQIRDAEGHYFVQVKGNQPALLNDLQEAFSPSEAGDGPSVGRGAGGVS